MVRRMNIFGLIFMILVFQKRVASGNEISSTTEGVSTPKSTSPESLNSSNREVPSIFPSNGVGGKPIISLNETVETPNLSDIRINLDENDVTVENTTNRTKDDVNVTVKPDTITEGNVSTSAHYQVNSTQAPNSETDCHLAPTEEADQRIAENSSKPVDTEVVDLLKIPKEKYDIVPVSPNIIYEPNQDVNLSIMLFDNVLQSEDSLRNHSDHQRENVGVIQGKLAAILAAVFLVVAIFGYISLLSWRRFLEHRYGNREMLVNEEDFYTEDLGHFSI